MTETAGQAAKRVKGSLKRPTRKTSSRRKQEKPNQKKLLEQQAQWHSESLEKYRQELALNRQKALEAVLGRSGIPMRFRGKTFDNYEASNTGQKRAWKTAKGYADKFSEVMANGTCMMFVGDPGTGKTHLACAILNQIIRQGYSGMFMSTFRAVTSVFETYRTGESTEAALNRLTTPDLLVLDEFGEQSGKAGESRTIFEILNTRYADMRPTILLTNEDYGVIETFLQSKWISRIEEAGGVILRFDWENYRKNIQFEKREK